MISFVACSIDYRWKGGNSTLMLILYLNNITQKIDLLVNLVENRVAISYTTDKSILAYYHTSILTFSPKLCIREQFFILSIVFTPIALSLSSMKILHSYSSTAA